MTSPSPVLTSFDIPTNGKATRLTDEATHDHLLDASCLTWVHLDFKHPHLREWLTANAELLEPFVCDALMTHYTRPRCEPLGDGFLVILRGANTNENKDPEDMVSLRLWVSPNYVISLSPQPIRAIKDLETALTQDTFIRSSGDVLTYLSTRLFLILEPYITKLTDLVDAAEEQLDIDVHAIDQNALGELRRDAIIFRRFIAPQREIMTLLDHSNIHWLSGDNRQQLRESHDRLMRYVEELETVRERAQIVKDEVTSVLSERLNLNLYKVSIVTVIFLPLAFLTGLLGINVEGIPFANHPDAFLMVCLGCLLMTLILIFTLKYRKWL